MSPSTVRTTNQLKALLRRLRREQGLTQAELGSRLGLSQERISKIENHPERVNVDQLFTVLMALEAELLIRPKTSAASSVSAPSQPSECW